MAFDINLPASPARHPSTTAFEVTRAVERAYARHTAPELIPSTITHVQRR